MRSDELLKATIACDEERAASFIEQAHAENAPIFKYNDETAMQEIREQADGNFICTL